MNSTGGALDFDAVIHDTDFQRSIKNMESSITGMTRNVQKETSSIDDAFKRLGAAAAGVFAFNELANLPMKLIQVRGEFQQLEIAFTTMLGSKEKADRLFAQVVQLAATTPFDLKGVAQGAKQLLAYGVASEDITKTLTRLGDIASGLSIPLGDLTYLYGTTRTQGRLFAQDLNQFVGRGIPLIKLLADQFNVAESEVKKLVEQGKVGFPEVEKAINKLTDQGGMFAGLMEASSKSLTGLYSNFQDTIEQTFNAIGKSQEGLLASGILTATEIVQNYDKIIDVLKVVIAAYGTYRAALIATAAVQALPATVTSINLFVDLARTIRSAADAQAFFNLVTGLNPYVVAATALITLITAMAIFNETLSEGEKAQENFNKAVSNGEKTFIEQKLKIDQLKKAVQDETKTEDERKKKLEELIALSPKHLNGLTLANIATTQGTEAINGYNKAMQEKIRQDTINNQLIENQIRIAEIKAGKADSEFGPSSLARSGMMQAQAASGGTFDAGKEAQIEIEKNKKIALKELSDQNKKLLDESGRGIDARRKQRTKELTDLKALDVAYYDAQIQSLEEQKKKATSLSQTKDIQRDIDALDEKRRAITGALTKDQIKLQKEAAKVGPYGSADYWDYIANKAQEIINKTPISQTGKIAQQQKILTDAQAKAEQARKLITIKSFEEEFEEKKKQYQLYERWAEQYGEASAKEQFAVLTKQSADYVTYLNTEIKKLESIRDFTPLNAKDAERLIGLKTERDDATGKKSAIEKFKDDLDSAKASAGSLTEYLEYLKNKQNELATKGPSKLITEQKIEVADQTNNVTKERDNQLREFLLSVSNSKQKQLEIEQHYNDLIAAANAQYADKSSAPYLKAIKDINLAKNKELQDQKQRLFEESKEFKALSDIITSTGRQAIEDKLKRAKDAKDKALLELGIESDAYKRYAAEVKNLEKDLSDNTLETFNKIVSIAGSLGNAFEGIGGGLADVGGLLSGIASQSANITTVIDKNASSTDKWMAAAQGVVNMISLVADASKRRKAAEAEYQRSLIQQQQEYNLSLNDTIGLQTELRSNIFTTDFEGKLSDGIAKMTDAQIKYQESLDKLDEGRAKAGQRDAVDWKAVGQGAASGATIGGAIGSVIPVVGNVVGAAVGAVVGGIVGLFAGKKKKDSYVDLLQEYPELIQKTVDGVDQLNVELAKSLIAQNLVDDATKDLLNNTIEWTEQIKAANEQIESVIKDLSGSLGDDLRQSLVAAFEAGEDSAKAFGESVSKVIENIVSQLLFNAVFGKAFEDLQKQMIASYKDGGDGNLIDDLEKFFAVAGPLTEQYNKGLQAAQDQAKANGLDIFTGDKTKDKTGLSGQIASISEETGNLLAGSINALRIYSADTNQVVRSQLLVLNDIRGHTSYLISVDTSLLSIAKTLKNMENADPLRGKGL